MLEQHAIQLHILLLLPAMFAAFGAFGATLHRLGTHSPKMAVEALDINKVLHARVHLANKGGLVGLLLATLAFKALLQQYNLGLQSCIAALMLRYAAIPRRNDCSEIINGLVQRHDPKSLNIS